MITITSAEAQKHFGELVDQSQREPVQITRHGRVAAYVVGERDLRAWSDLRQRREEAAAWYAQYRRQAAEQADTALTDEDVNRLVHELR